MKINLNFLLLLTLVFVVLKLTEVIAWSWWWVFAPMILGAALFIAILSFMLVIAIIVGKQINVKIPWGRHGRPPF
jgi:hypothetical protein